MKEILFKFYQLSIYLALCVIFSFTFRFVYGFIFSFIFRFAFLLGNCIILRPANIWLRYASKLILKIATNPLRSSYGGHIKHV